MKDFQNGWSGLKEYAIKVGVATVDDGDDGVASKIKAVLQGTLPEEDAAEGSEALVSGVAETLGLGEE